MKKKIIKKMTATLGIFLCLTIVYFFSAGLITKNSIQRNNEIHAPIEIAAINKIVQEEMALQEIVGCAVGVVRNGQIVHVKGYGYLDLAQTKPVTENTVFRWASISKTLTAVAAFKAIEDGKLNLNDKIKDRVSLWSSTGDKGLITIRNLLNNRGGVPHYGSDGCSYTKSAYKSFNNFNADECVNVFKDCNLASKPGTEFKYSTFGFNLLGAAIEKATGIPYEKYVQDNIAAKVSMSSLKPYANDPGGYEKDCNNKLKPATEGVVEWKLPGGGWSSNIYDLTRFMSGLVNGKFLTNTSALWQSVPDNSGYAFGTYRQVLGSGRLHVNHGGTHNGLRTYMSFFPDDKSGVCVVINGGAYIGAGGREQLTKKIQNAIGYGWTVNDTPQEYCGENTSCGEQMIGLWRKTDNGNIIMRRGYTHDNFYKAWNELIKLGYYCSDFETYLDGSVRKWDGIFKKGSSASAMWRGFSTDDFNTKWNEMNAAGFRLIDIETYMEGTTRKWAGLFIKTSGPYALWRGFNTDDFGVKNAEMAKAGYKLIDIESYMDGTTLKWAGVWLGTASYLLNRNYDLSPFRDLLRERVAAGWKLVDVESYQIGTTRKWAGIWEKSTQAERFMYDRKCCLWLEDHKTYRADGYELIDFSKY